MRKTYSAVLLTALTAILFGIGAPSAQAQRRVQLVNFATTSWRYWTNGTDQGTAWRSRTFADGAWPSGLGLLGVETTPNIYPYPFNTPFPAYDPNIITFYFRAHFNMSAQDFVWPLTLVMSNLVDDGCLVYLNSNFVASFRVAQNAVYTAVATGGPAAEGGYETPMNISTNGLLLGDNVIAVEVHQTGTGSSDIVNGLSLTAIVPTAMAITKQPPAQSSTTVGVSVPLTVELSGGPGLYQWQSNNASGVFINVVGATSTNFNFPPTAVGTWTFRFVASNGLGMVISSNAVVNVANDLTGPLMLSANVREEATRTNRIDIAWNETLNSATALTASNYTVVLFPSNIVVGVSNVQYNPGTFPAPDIPPTVTLTMNSTNWNVRSNYCVFVNNVRDVRNNTIAPNSRICVAWPTTTNVMQMGEAWDFFAQHFLYTNFVTMGLSNMYDQPWMATNYVVDPTWWGLANGIIFKDQQSLGLLCAGDTLGNEIAVQDEPALFRRKFMLPANLNPTSVQLKLRYIIDDGAVFYLNGKELTTLRVNMSGAAGTPIDAATRAASDVVTPTCQTNDNYVLPGGVQLNPGMNTMAVAVAQSIPGSGGADDIYFGLEMDVRMYGSSPTLTATTATNVLPKIHPSKLTPTTMRMFWTNGIGSRSNGFGFAVVSSPTLQNATWTEVQPIQMNGTLTSNIFTSTALISNVPTMGPQLFYRLRRVQPLP